MTITDTTVPPSFAPANLRPSPIHQITQRSRHDDIASLPTGPAVFVDMSGNAAVVAAVHGHYGDDLAHSAMVGMTHWEARRGSVDPMPGPAQTLFFAPSQIEKRRKDWGPGVIDAKLGAAWGPFLEQVSGWIEIQHGHGLDAVIDVYVEMLENRTRPDTAHALHP